MDIKVKTINFNPIYKYSIITRNITLQYRGTTPDLSTYTAVIMATNCATNEVIDLSDFVETGVNGLIAITFPYAFTSIPAAYDYDLYLVGDEGEPSVETPTKIFKGSIVVPDSISTVIVT